MLTIDKSFKNTEPMSQNIDNNVIEDDTMYVPVTDDDTIYVPVVDNTIYGGEVGSAKQILELAKKSNNVA